MLSFCTYYITIKLGWKRLKFNFGVLHKLEVTQLLNIDLVY